MATSGSSEPTACMWAISDGVTRYAVVRGLPVAPMWCLASYVATDGIQSPQGRMRHGEEQPNPLALVHARLACM